MKKLFSLVARDLVSVSLTAQAQSEGISFHPPRITARVLVGGAAPQTTYYVYNPVSLQMNRPCNIMRQCNTTPPGNITPRSNAPVDYNTAGSRTRRFIMSRTLARQNRPTTLRQIARRTHVRPFRSSSLAGAKPASKVTASVRRALRFQIEFSHFHTRNASSTLQAWASQPRG